MKIYSKGISINDNDLKVAIGSKPSGQQRAMIKQLYDMRTMPTNEDVARLTEFRLNIDWFHRFLSCADDIEAAAPLLKRIAQSKLSKELKPKRQARKTKRGSRAAKGRAPDFYTSDEWRALRWRVLENYGFECMACGRSKRDHGVVLHVDHIKPRSTHPHLALVYDNLQVLCEDCNKGKSNKSTADLRPHTELD